MDANINKKTLEDALQAKTVAEIYGDLDTRPAQKFQRAPVRRKNYIIFVIIAILLIGAGLAWTGYNLFNSQVVFQQDNVLLDIKAPTTVASGETITYKIEYINNDKNSFSEGVLDVVYPEGFVVTETIPSAANNEKTRWNLGLVKSREQGVIEIKGQLTGKNEESKTINTTLTYRPIGTSKPIELKKSSTIIVRSSVLQLEVKGPSQVVAGERAVYRIVYKNFSNIENKDKVSVNVTYPEGFVFVEAYPRPDEGQGVWNSTSLLTGLESNASTGAIEITGVVNGSQGSDGVITAQIGFKNGDQFQIEHEQSLTTQVASGDLILLSSVNGSQENSNAKFGDTLKIAISYENRGANTLSGLTIKANIEGDVVDWANFKDQNGGVFTAGQIAWTSREISALAELPPQSKGIIETTIKIKGSDAISNLRLSGATDDGKEVAVKISATAEVSGAVSSDGMPVLQVPGAKSGTIIYTLATDLSFSGQLRYFSDTHASIGAGPLPPKAGEATTYQVQWKINNTVHNADSVLVRTTLPEYVEWVSRSNSSSGDLSYNSATREVTWRMSRLGSGAGESATFDVQYKARSQDINKVVTIINSTSVSARDASTGKAIELKDEILTSNLDRDPVGYGRGVVVQ